MNNDLLQPRSIRSFARGQMYKAIPAFWLVTLIAQVLTTLLPDIVTTFAPAVGPDGSVYMMGLFLTILTTMFSWVVNLGYAWWALDSADGREGEDAPSVRTLFNGFSIFSKVVVMNFLIGLYTALWSMLAVIPTTIVVTYALLAALESGSAGAYTLFAVLTIGLVLLFAYVISLRYRLAPYLLIQAGEFGSGAQAIRDSVALMRGWKWKLFRLDLSFLGWRLAILGLELAGVVVMGLLGFVNLTALSAAAASGDIVSAGLLIFANPVVALMAALLPLPLDLWLTPYVNIASARFFRLRHLAAAGPVSPGTPPPADAPWEGPVE